MSSSTRSRSRIPPLLQPVVSFPPKDSLSLLTGVLDATPHWLVSRFVGSALDTSEESGNEVDETTNGITKVLLVSWMRDWDYWRNELRRGAGLDLARLANEGRIAFVDGVTGLFSGDSEVSSKSRNVDEQRIPSVPSRGSTVLPQRGPAPTRTAAVQPARQPLVQNTNSSPSQTSKGRSRLTSPSLPHTAEMISQTLLTLQTSPNDKILLILDSPTTLLSTTPTSSKDLSSLILCLREKLHSTLVVAESDTPFLAAANPAAFLGAGDYLTPSSQQEKNHAGTFAPLEKEIASFVVGLGHSARMIVGTRGLDTGVARDVSGVLRVCRGGCWDEDGEEETRSDGREETGRDMEVLYHVAADGSVRVFERGGGDIG